MIEVIIKNPEDGDYEGTKIKLENNLFVEIGNIALCCCEEEYIKRFYDTVKTCNSRTAHISDKLTAGAQIEEQIYVLRAFDILTSEEIEVIFNLAKSNAL